MHKYQFDAIEIDFLGRSITPAGVKPPNKELLTSWKLEKKQNFRSPRRPCVVILVSSVTTEIIFQDCQKTGTIRQTP